MRVLPYSWLKCQNDISSTNTTPMFMTNWPNACSNMLTVDQMRHIKLGVHYDFDPDIAIPDKFLRSETKYPCRCLLEACGRHRRSFIVSGSETQSEGYQSRL